MQTAGRRVLLVEGKACAKVLHGEGNVGRPMFLAQSEPGGKVGNEV